MARCSMTRSRGPNNATMTETLTDEQRVFGAEQIAWLKRELANSSATWKVIALTSRWA